MNYSMGDSELVEYGNSVTLLPEILTVALGWVLFGVIALAFGYVVLLAVAKTFKLGPYSPAGIARAEARRVAAWAAASAKATAAARAVEAWAAEETDID